MTRQTLLQADLDPEMVDRGQSRLPRSAPQVLYARLQLQPVGSSTLPAERRSSREAAAAAGQAKVARHERMAGQARLGRRSIRPRPRAWFRTNRAFVAGAPPRGCREGPQATNATPRRTDDPVARLENQPSRAANGTKRSPPAAIRRRQER